jgi:hypothetical protein
MTQVDEAEVRRQKAGVLRFQIGQSYQLVYDLVDPPPCSMACVNDWWMLRLKEHWTAAFWESGRLPVMLYQVSELTPELEAIARNVVKGLAPGATRRAVHGTWKLLEVGDQGRRTKGEREAKKAIALAIEAVLEHKDRTRRDVVELVMQYFSGREALHLDGRRRSTRDPVYRAAYEKANRHLKRGYKLAGEPADLRHLI